MKNMCDRLVIINADDWGVTRSTNLAIFELLRQQSITSASMIMPALKARNAARLYRLNRNAAIGVHLTLTSTEQHLYKPVYQGAPLGSLVTPDGYFHHDSSKIELTASPDEVKVELEAQIQAALSYGIEITHLDSHAGSVLGIHHGRDFLEIVFDLCEKYRLPFTLPLRTVEQPIFNNSQKDLFQLRIQSAKRRGIYLIDDLAGLPYHLAPNETYAGAKEELMHILRGLKPGITQITTHPAIATPELRAFTPQVKKREIEYRLYQDPDIKALFKHEEIQLISWRTIRDWQRRASKPL